MPDLTLILNRMDSGDTVAANELYQHVYQELRSLAAAKLAREHAAHTFQPTVLVHEAWLRLGGDNQPSWNNRRHFFAAAAEAMRRILIDEARRRLTRKHGGELQRENIDEVELALDVPDERVIAVSEALERLAALDPAKAELVKLRYFVGMSIAEAALALEISEPTAKRWWAFARAWLFDAIRKNSVS